MDNKYFARRPDIISLIIVTLHIAIVVAPVYISVVLGPGLHMILCWLFFGLGMNGLINLMHECCHYLVFKEKLGSEFLGKYILAPMAFADFHSYRKRHWDHHKFLGVEGETKDTYQIDIHRGHIAALLFRCLFGLEALNKFRKQLKSEKEKSKYAAGAGWIGRVYLFQALFFLSLALSAYYFGRYDWITALSHASTTYLVVYFYGLMSLTVFMADLRGIAEHQIYDQNDTTEGYASLRNFKCNLFSRFCLGAYGFGEHYTHHKVPGIPYYSLPQATKEMAQEDSSMIPKTSYFSILLKLIEKKNSSVSKKL